MILLVFPAYLFQADAQLPGSMSTEIHENVVVLNTKQGKMVIQLFSGDAPLHVKNFLDLVQSGFYDRTIFHRIIPEFMIQGGDPTSKPGTGSPWDWGKGDPGYSIDAEFNQIKHNRGIVSMARSADPDSAGSQFFIVHKNSNFLDGEYTVFGQLITQESYDTLDALAALPTTTIGPPNGVGSVSDIPTAYGNAEITSAEIQKHSEIENKLQLGMPERMTSTVKQIPNNIPYTNSEFAFSLDVPRGFIATEPERMDEGTPVVTFVGERTGKYAPAVYVQVTTPTANTFEEVLEKRLELLRPAIESGEMEFLGQDWVEVNGMAGYSVTVKTRHVTEYGPEILTFKQFLFPANGLVYSLVFSDASDHFPSSLNNFELIVNSFQIKSLSDQTTIKETMQETSQETSSSEEGGGCLIATAAFGSEMAPQVQFLRELRDNTVLQTQSGTSFMTGFNQFYYSFSPVVADLERENPVFKEAVKLTLTPLLASLTLLNYVDIDSESEMLGYGIGIIMLNIGMYFVAPAILIVSVKKLLIRKKI